MSDDAVEVTSELPGGFDPESVIRFFPEYSLRHPLWFHFGHPDLADLRLPDDLADRLHRWSTYWDSTFQWDHGWPAGAPVTWWAEEKDRLPRDVATTVGSSFVVETADKFLHSTTEAVSLATAAAVRALVDAEADDRAKIRADLANGALYDFVANGTNYTEWLASRGRDAPPAE